MYEFDVVNMKHCCDEMRQIVSVMQDNLQSLENLVMGIHGSWQGEAEQIYEAKIIYVRYRYTVLLEFFEQYIEVLEKSSDICGEEENNIRNKLLNV